MSEKPVKILCIEDEKSVRTSLRDLLENSGYDVVTADNGKDAVKLIHLITPDLILCDIMLPGMNGYKILENTLLNKNTRNIPFLFLTAKSKMQDLRLGMNMGADDYIVKPFKAGDLLASISARLHKRRQSASRSQPDSSSGSDHIFINSTNNPKLIKLSDIKFIEANGTYSDLILQNNKRITHRKLLKEWEDLLDSNKFIRIHRSTIININFIDEIKKTDHRNYVIRLTNYQKSLKVSQRCSSKLKASFLS